MARQGGFKIKPYTPAIILILVGVYVQMYPDSAIRIAVVFPMTGADSSAGQVLLRGAELAHHIDSTRLSQLVDSIGYKNYEFELIALDDRSSIRGARDNARRAVANHGVKIIVGHYNSSETAAGLQIYKDEQVPLIMPTATQTDLTHSFSNVFRLPPSNEIQSEEVVRFVLDSLVMHLKISRDSLDIYLFHDTLAYSTNIAKAIKDELQERSIRWIGSSIVRAGQENFTPVLSSLSPLRSSIDVFLFAGYGSEAAFLIRQARRLGFDAPFVATDGVYGTSFHRLGGENMGEVYVLYQAPPLEMLRERGKKWQEYYDSIKEYSGENPAAWSAWSYDAVRMAYDAIEILIRKGDFPSRKAIAKVLAEDKYTFSGALYEYSFDRFKNNKNSDYYVYAVTDTGYCYIPCAQANSDPD